MIRKATKEDKKVLEGLGEFIESLEIDILKEVSMKTFQEILNYVFESEEDRFSHKYCTVYEENGEILGFSFGYHYNKLDEMRDFWFNDAGKRFDLQPETIIFDYDELLPNEYYLDTLYVFSDSRGKGVGNKLLTQFVKENYSLKSLNVAQSNHGARRLYESYGFKKDCEIYIGHEHYDHMIVKK
ncbi:MULTISPECIES: GNAT family N-acetyltransferase [Gemella]|uniref:GNAT family N-acetyltransferase n=1 Tax=Gemella TaxID=1378 RepID=UPI000767F82C|nr:MULTISPECIES: GNAT family N-acetyltransferase [Gemella]AME09089.1 acetyltransferase [Gemella sp. oral taxon 928]AXI26661.1 N-acetyltransferase [Gemella sp. ND 6198]